MNQTFMNDADSCEWLADKINQQAPGTGAMFQSAILYGNEDCPIAVDLFRDSEPLITDSFQRIALSAYDL